MAGELRLRAVFVRLHQEPKIIRHLPAQLLEVPDR
jgi:hypothetical protein